MILKPKHAIRHRNIGDRCHRRVCGRLSSIAGLGDERIPAGRACVVPDCIGPAMVKADCFRFRLNEFCLVTQYVAYQLSSTARIASVMLSTGATRQRVNLQAASARYIAVPPYDEQTKIVDYLNRKLDPLEETITEIQKGIHLLAEYRIRLIADVVTGKIDVRGLYLPEINNVDVQGAVD
ncbi:MAG: restriction endonuclease subunit S, partial [Chloroflexi bacterium]|nr:restriction endonuclease subunit S [Chloroflexota bacterium]